MGKDYYYLEAIFDDPGVAERAYKVARVILEDLARLYDDWKGMKSKLNPFEAHKILMERHPYAFAFIRIPWPTSDDDIDLNYLAGSVNIHTDCLNSGFRLDGNKIYLKCLVREFAYWRNIIEFFLNLGARKVVFNIGFLIPLSGGVEITNVGGGTMLELAEEMVGKGMTIDDALEILAITNPGKRRGV